MAEPLCLAPRSSASRLHPLSPSGTPRDHHRRSRMRPGSPEAGGPRDPEGSEGHEEQLPWPLSKLPSQRQRSFNDKPANPGSGASPKSSSSTASRSHSGSVPATRRPGHTRCRSSEFIDLTAAASDSLDLAPVGGPPATPPSRRPQGPSSPRDTSSLAPSFQARVGADLESKRNGLSVTTVLSSRTSAGAPVHPGQRIKRLMRCNSTDGSFTFKPEGGKAASDAEGYQSSRGWGAPEHGHAASARGAGRSPGPACSGSRSPSLVSGGGRRQGGSRVVRVPRGSVHTPLVPQSLPVLSSPVWDPSQDDLLRAGAAHAKEDEKEAASAGEGQARGGPGNVALRTHALKSPQAAGKPVVPPQSQPPPAGSSPEGFDGGPTGFPGKGGGSLGGAARQPRPKGGRMASLMQEAEAGDRASSGLLSQGSLIDGCISAAESPGGSSFSSPERGGESGVPQEERLLGTVNSRETVAEAAASGGTRNMRRGNSFGFRVPAGPEADAADAGGPLPDPAGSGKEGGGPFSGTWKQGAAGASPGAPAVDPADVNPLAPAAPASSGDASHEEQSSRDTLQRRRGGHRRSRSFCSWEEADEALLFREEEREPKPALSHQRHRNRAHVSPKASPSRVRPDTGTLAESGAPFRRPSPMRSGRASLVREAYVLGGPKPLGSSHLSSRFTLEALEDTGDESDAPEAAGAPLVCSDWEAAFKPGKSAKSATPLRDEDSDLEVCKTPRGGLGGDEGSLCLWASVEAEATESRKEPARNVSLSDDEGLSGRRGSRRSSRRQSVRQVSSARFPGIAWQKSGQHASSGNSRQSGSRSLSHAEGPPCKSMPRDGARPIKNTGEMGRSPSASSAGKSLLVDEEDGLCIHVDRPDEPTPPAVKANSSGSRKRSELCGEAGATLVHGANTSRGTKETWDKEVHRAGRSTSAGLKPREKSPSDLVDAAERRSILNAGDSGEMAASLPSPRVGRNSGGKMSWWGKGLVPDWGQGSLKSGAVQSKSKPASSKSPNARRGFA